MLGLIISALPLWFGPKLGEEGQHHGEPRRLPQGQEGGFPFVSVDKPGWWVGHAHLQWPESSEDRRVLVIQVALTVTTYSGGWKMMMRDQPDGRWLAHVG